MHKVVNDKNNNKKSKIGKKIQMSIQCQMMYNINLNYIKWLENADVKVLPIFEFQTKSCVMSCAIFENIWFAGRSIISCYIIMFFKYDIV
jgi:hypothetical protein